MATPIKKEENEFLKLNKENRCTTLARGDYIPGSYKDNTLKEELILEHVLQYKKEFGLTYDSKRDQNKSLYERGNHDIPILEKSIFDIDAMLGDSDQDKDKNEYSGNQQLFDRIALFLKIQKEKMEGKEDHDKIKEDIIKAFKDEKTTVTNVLQKLLKEQVTELQSKIENFKSKETYGKEEIEKHNIEVNEIQRKINIIYQRSHKHITKIMEELNELLEKMDENFAKDS